MSVRDPDLWTCPRCGARFVTRNMWHGCGEYTVDGFFEGKPARLRKLYDAWVSLVRESGPFEQVPTKSRIAFMVRVRFAGVARLRKDGLVCGFWLKRRIDPPRFTKVEHLGENGLDLSVRAEGRERARRRGARLDPGSLRRRTSDASRPVGQGTFGSVGEENSLARRFLQRAGLDPTPTIQQVVEAIRNVPYARPIDTTAEGVVSEWRGTCSTKTALLVLLTRSWWPELEPRIAHRVYHLAPDLARTLFGDEAASLISHEGLTDVHTYATLHLDGRRVIVDVTFPGAAWDGCCDMALACGDGIDFDGGIDPWGTKARLVSENCDPDARETFIETLSRRPFPGHQ